MLTLGDMLLSLGSDRKLLVWAPDVYDAPKVTDLTLHFGTLSALRNSTSSLPTTASAKEHNFLCFLKHAEHTASVTQQYALNPFSSQQKGMKWV